MSAVWFPLWAASCRWSGGNCSVSPSGVRWRVFGRAAWQTEARAGDFPSSSGDTRLTTARLPTPTEFTWLRLVYIYLDFWSGKTHKTLNESHEKKTPNHWEATEASAATSLHEIWIFNIAAACELQPEARHISCVHLLQRRISTNLLSDCFPLSLLSVYKINLCSDEMINASVGGKHEKVSYTVGHCVQFSESKWLQNIYAFVSPDIFNLKYVVFIINSVFDSAAMSQVFHLKNNELRHILLWEKVKSLNSFFFDLWMLWNLTTWFTSSRHTNPWMNSAAGWRREPPRFNPKTTNSLFEYLSVHQSPDTRRD